jgi:hypothetical protein
MVFGPFVFWTLASIFVSGGKEDLLWRFSNFGVWINRDLILPDVTMLGWPFVAMAGFTSSQVFNTGRAGLTVFLAVAVQSIPILLSSAVFLLLARRFVVRRAFVQPRNPLLALFQALDRTFTRLNENRWTKGIVLVEDATSLPDDEPVAWRETSRRSLGQARYMLRIFLALEVPLLILCLLLTIADADGSAETGSYLIFFLWGLAVLLVCVQAASLIGGEKSHQTLDVLCTTPLAAREIVEQKFRGVRRLILVLLVPFCTVVAFQCWWRSLYHHWDYRGQRVDTPLYLACSVLSLAVYLPMVAWLALWIGLKVRTQARAIIGSLAAIVGWCVGPIIFCVFPIAITTGPSKDMEFTLLISPMMIIIINEFDGLHAMMKSPWAGMVVNFLGYGGALAVFRGMCLNRAEALLGRLEAR